MKSLAGAFLGAALIAAVTLIVVPGPVLANTSSTTAAQQRVHGTVVGTQGSTLTVKADDGRTLTVDMKAVNPQVQKALTKNEGVTVIGTPGAQANHFTAQFIQQDSSNASRGGKVAGQAAPPASAPTTASSSASGEWQHVHGSVVNVQGQTLTFKTDDGRTLTVDMKAVNPQVQQALKANEAATLIGHPGASGNQFTAQFIQQDSSNPARGGKVAGGQTAPATTSGGTDTAWQRVHGTVGSVSGNTLTLKTTDGQTVTVDMANVDAGTRGNLAAGEAVTVIGFYGVDASKNVDKKNLHARFIQKDSSSGAAASPKTTK